VGQSEDYPRRKPQHSVAAFDEAFARLRAELEQACAARPEWPLKVATAIRVAFCFAAADPGAAQALTNDALAGGADGIAHHERLIAHLREGLVRGRQERPENGRLPEITEQAMASGVVMLVAQRVDQGRAAELPALVPEAIQFVLTPYLGAEEARRIGAEYIKES
jgi:hypothetical protein